MRSHAGAWERKKTRLFMEIRTAIFEDSDSIAQLHADSWRVAYRGIFKDEFLDKQAFQNRKNIWRERFTMPKNNQHILVAVENLELLGFVCAFGNEDTQWGTYIDNLHVTKVRTRQGIGRSLMIEIARWSNRHYPGAGLYLGVLEPNIAARRFYESLGAINQEARLWEPPGGGEVVDLLYVWSKASHLLNEDDDEPADT